MTKGFIAFAVSGALTAGAFAAPALAGGIFESTLVPSTSGDNQVIRSFTATGNAASFDQAISSVEVTDDFKLEVKIFDLQMTEGGFAGDFPPEGAQVVLDCASGPQFISDPVGVMIDGLTEFEVDVSEAVEGADCRAPVVLVIRFDNKRWVAVSGFAGPAE